MSDGRNWFVNRQATGGFGRRLIGWSSSAGAVVAFGMTTGGNGGDAVGFATGGDGGHAFVEAHLGAPAEGTAGSEGAAASKVPAVRAGTA